MSGIKITNLSYSISEKKIINNINLSIPSQKSLSIIGNSASGKTTLLKIICGLITKYNGEININSQNSIPYINQDLNIKEESLAEILKDIKKNKEDYNNITSLFSLKKIINEKISNLPTEKKYLIKIIKETLNNPDYICIDDVLSCLSYRNRIILLNYLEQKKIHLINVTSNIEDVIYTDYLLCLYNGKNVIDGKTLEVLKNEKIIKRMGFTLPFMVDLSLQLKSYDLIKGIYLDNELMVKKIWK